LNKNLLLTRNEPSKHAPGICRKTVSIGGNPDDLLEELALLDEITAME
jgi:hypothetical protein